MAESTSSRLSGPWHVTELVDRLEQELAQGNLPPAPRTDPMEPGAPEPPD